MLMLNSGCAGVRRKGEVYVKLPLDEIVNKPV
jgi:hypothetical protein